MGKKNNFKKTNKSNVKPQKDAVKVKVPTETRVYTKSFDNFSEAIKEIREISEVFDKFIDRFYPTDEEIIVYSPEDLSMRFYDYIREHRFPSIHDKNTKFWSISVASNKMYVKTEFKITFGWQFKYRYDPAIKDNVVDQYDFVISDIGSNDDLKEKAVNKSWEFATK